MALNLTRLLSLLALLALILPDNVAHSLKVSNYGNYQLSMLRHGEKYATNRDCYTWEDVLPWYYGMVHARGPNDKPGLTEFFVDVPVMVFVALDTRHDPIRSHPFFKATDDYIYLGGCHARTKFRIYESKVTRGPGRVTITPFGSPMYGVFVRDARLIQPFAHLRVSSLPGPLWSLSMVRDGEKFSNDRACYAMTDVLPKYHGMLHLRGPNDKPRVIRFTIDCPAILYVAIDSRYPSPLRRIERFRPTNEKLVHAGCHPRTDFLIFHKRIDIPGEVTIKLKQSRMLAIFLKPADVDNSFKSGVYA